MSAGSSQSQVDSCLRMKDFATAWPCIENMPHTGGHAGVGGQVSAPPTRHLPLLLTLLRKMQNGVSSPGDPLFYLHHTWLDKVFWDWQARDRQKRVSSIGGTNIGPDYSPGFPPRPASIP